MTDKLSGSELVEKTFFYISALTKECRKALTIKFESEHKGISFDSIEAIMRREIESWFTLRDRNVKLSFTDTMLGKPGELIVTYSGSTKDAHFKIHINSLFTLVGSSVKVLSYLKSLNIKVDKREFTK